MVVVLPDPFEPTKPKISPCRIVKLARSTAVKSPNRQVRSLAMITDSALPSRGGPTISSRVERCRSGSRATKASSMEPVWVLCFSSAGVPVARILPSFMAISQSKRPASAM
jgi:hypothetical protein